MIIPAEAYARELARRRTNRSRFTELVLRSTWRVALLGFRQVIPLFRAWAGTALPNMPEVCGSPGREKLASGLSYARLGAIGQVEDSVWLAGSPHRAFDSLSGLAGRKNPLKGLLWALAKD